MDKPPCATAHQLMARVRAVSESVDRAREAVLADKTPAAAVFLQQEQRRLKEARDALPPLRLVGAE